MLALTMFNLVQMFSTVNKYVLICFHMQSSYMSHVGDSPVIKENCIIDLIDLQPFSHILLSITVYFCDKYCTPDSASVLW